MRHRRGSNIVEFGLIVPGFLALLSGIIDYGWYFSNQVVFVSIVSECAKAAALTHEDHAAAAIAHCNDATAEAGFTAVTVSATVVPASETLPPLIEVHTTAGYDPFVGLLPAVSELDYDHRVHMRLLIP